MRALVPCIAAAVSFPAYGQPTGGEQRAEGVVYEDRDRDGRRSPSEPGIPSVRVSNGRSIVRTDPDGRYEINVDDDDVVFVIKPRNYISPLDSFNIARFYYIHKPHGSPRDLQHAGVEPTGPLPASIDFPLIHHAEPDRFDVIVLGDPQSRNMQEIGYLAHDIIEELLETKADFVVALGDIAFDDLSVYGPYNQVMSVLNKPIINIFGNHDINIHGLGDDQSDETWERVYGPTTYSFDWGPVHFLVIDNVYYEGYKQRGKYHGEFGRNLEFIKNDLALVPKSQMTVLLMHIPLTETSDRVKLYKLLAGRPHTFSMSSHWHMQKHCFIGSSDGWPGEGSHHHLIHGTACGAWWEGALDEYGIPHAMMRDGAPNGYSIATFARDKYSLRFKAARRPASHQMSIFLPDTLTVAEANTTSVIANYFAGGINTKMDMRVGRGPWRPMKRDVRPDPYLKAIKDARARGNAPNGRKLSDLVDSPHLWTAPLPQGLTVGPHVIEVRAVDMFEQQSIGRRILLVAK